VKYDGVKDRNVTKDWRSAAIGILIVILLWQVAVMFLALPMYVLPSPLAILTQADWAAVVDSSGHSMVAILLGFAVGNIAGFFLAVLAASSVLASGVVQPLSVMLRSVPIIAIAPLLTLLFGRGIGVTVVVGALVVFFPTLVNMLIGLRSTEREVLELMKILDCSRLQRFWVAQLPTSMPYLVSSLRIAAPSAVLGVMVAEWIVGGDGLGQLVLRSSMTIEYPTMWAAVLASAVLAGLMFAVVALLERVLMPWQSRRR
jgi:NitT/TauT family transport system permease protein